MKKTVATLATAAILSATFSTTASADTHKVQKGDTLSQLAKKYNTTVNHLKKWNQLSSDRIFISQTLTVTNPEDESTPPSSTTSTDITTVTPITQVATATTVTKTYKVVSGDTLIGIANKHGISLTELRSWNSIEGHLIYPGQVFHVSKPSNTSSQPAITTPSLTENATATEYVIKSGDTLSKIGSTYGLTVQQLKSYNNLTSDLIFPGQKLKLKAQAGSTQVSSSKQLNVVQTSAPAEVSPAITSVVNVAKGLVGTPYVWGGTTTAGFDCSGFIYYVFNQAGKSMSRYSSQGYYDRSFDVSNPQVGDLVFFENTYKQGISHLGVYLGNNQFVHAGSDGVEVNTLDNSYWGKHFESFKRFY
ncbi:LysM peptidoglycan-binding domain-containing protein [Bacillus sp. V3B]|uniref:C40 family peptidase n=1 Tax=Bacillus sp. V3B TaxID=2804915 RepID=UPI00210A7B48|nr:peptidoglycan endopeptidase [Bacillus sp. V3B]MCQ6274655.1 LysM peptidoglycan-binding domain-containing protein [Bacillus sp. V3B]